MGDETKQATNDERGNSILSQRRRGAENSGNTLMGMRARGGNEGLWITVRASSLQLWTDD